MADIKAYRILDLSARVQNLELVTISGAYKDPKTGKTTRPPRPKVLAIGPQEFFFLVSSTQDVSSLGVIVSETGEARRGTLQFTEVPKSIAYKDPYLYALFSDGRVEIHDTYGVNETLLKTIYIPKLQKPRRLQFINSYYINSFEPSVFSPKSAIISGSSDIPKENADFLVAHNKNKTNKPNSNLLDNLIIENITVLFGNSLEGIIKPSFFIEIDNLLNQKRVEEAIDMMEKTKDYYSKPDYSSNEARYLYQKAALIFLEGLLFDDALRYFLRGNVDPLLVLSLSKKTKQLLGSLLKPSDISSPSEILSIASDLQDIESIIYKSVPQLSTGLPEQSQNVLNTYLQSSNTFLMRFLEKIKSTKITGNTLTCIYTTLTVLYCEEDRLDKLEVVLKENKAYINIDIVISYLTSIKKFYYSSIVYKHFGFHDNCLDIYEDFISGKVKDDSFPGENDYIGYLENLKDEQTTIKRFYNLLKIDVSLAVDVFMLISPGAVAGLNIDSLIEKVKSCNDDKILSKFIKHLTTVHHSKSPLYMTLLAQIYIRDIERWFISQPSKGNQDSELSFDYKTELEQSYHIRKNIDPSLTFREYLRKMVFSVKVSYTDRERFRMVQEDDVLDNDKLNEQPRYYDQVLKRKMSKGFLNSLLLRNQLLLLITDPTQVFEEKDVLETIDGHAKTYLSFEQAVLLLRIGQVKAAVSLLVQKAQEFTEAEIICFHKKSPKSLSNLIPAGAYSSKHVSHAKSLKNTSESTSGGKTLFSKGDNAICPESKDHDLRLFLLSEYLKVEDPELSYSLVCSLLTRFSDQFQLNSIIHLIPPQWLFSPLIPFSRINFVSSKAQSVFSSTSTSLLNSRVHTLRGSYYDTLKTPASSGEFLEHANTMISGPESLISKISMDIISYNNSFSLAGASSELHPRLGRDINKAIEAKEPKHPSSLHPASSDSERGKKLIDYGSFSPKSAKPYFILQLADSCPKCGEAINIQESFAFFFESNQIKESGDGSSNLGARDDLLGVYGYGTNFGQFRIYTSRGGYIALDRKMIVT
ncbi:hypothetical protein BB560_001906 [Smittium megazygosporum]|nr:hypothetical protein BB560_001906 [Smittium megazygosporum]